MPGDYGQHIYGTQPMNYSQNGVSKAALAEDTYYRSGTYAQPKATYAYSSTLPVPQNQNQYNPADDYVDSDPAPQTGGMTRGDRFGTVLFDPADGMNADEPHFDNSLEAPVRNAPSVAPPPMSNGGTANHTLSRSTTVQLDDAIELLSSNNDVVRANAAAYIQHLMFRDESAKTRCRLLNGIPRLLRLVETGRAEAVRAGLGVILNVSTGRSNDENKRAIVAAGGIDVLLALLAAPQDSAEVHELVTGVLWNVATCRDVRRPLLDRATQPLVECVIKPHAERAFQLLQQVRILTAEMHQAAQPAANSDLAQRTSDLRVADQQVWSTVLRNATGALRCLSADGEVARRRLRESRFFISSLLVLIRLAIETREFASDRDNKVIENAVCVLRNVSYALQELADSTYIKRRRDEEARLMAATARRANTPANSGASDDHETVSCFRASVKKSSESTTSRPNPLLPPNLGANDDVAQLWNLETVRLYQAILAECCNPQTIEAAAGALQNLTACEWQPAVDIRTQLRKEKALPILIDLLNLNTDNIVLATVLCLRNLVIDQRNRELIGKHALGQLSGKLPLDERDIQLDTRSRYCTVNELSQGTLAAILATIHEVIAMPTKEELAEAERLRKKLEQQSTRRKRATSANGVPPSNTAEDDLIAASIKQNNPAYARMLLDCGCVPRLFFIMRSAAADAQNSNNNASTMRPRFDAKVLRFTQAVLYQLWLYTELRPEYFRRGWIERDFLPKSNAAIFSAQPQPPARSTSQLPLSNGNVNNAATLNRASQSTLGGPYGATMRSQPGRQAAPAPMTNQRMQQAPTMSRVGTPAALTQSAPYSNTMRSGVAPVPIGRSRAGTMRSQAGFDNLAMQRSMDEIDLNTSYMPDVRLPPAAAGRQPGTLQRPIGSVPRNLTQSHGALSAATLPQNGLEPTYSRASRRLGTQSNYDAQSIGNSIGQPRSQTGPLSSTMQLVPRNARHDTSGDDPVADSWV